MAKIQFMYACNVVLEVFFDTNRNMQYYFVENTNKLILCLKT